jgi:hypothetical protein
LADIAQDTITVAHTPSGEIFVFRVPSPRDYARMGAHAGVLRRRDVPESGGAEFGLDPLSQDLYRGFALFECLLEKADTSNNWPYTKDEKGNLTVDSSKFPPETLLTVPEVFQEFNKLLDEFLKKRTGHRVDAGEKGVGGQPGA